MNHIRNFCIIAHIDHGKSTLADRFLELTGTVEARKMRPQYLDRMELERERGITIKMAPVRMLWRPHIAMRGNPGFDLRASASSEYILNLIDTPGHSDFSYEVSRALAAVEGAILLIDSTKGIQAQTLSNLRAALSAGLTVIGAVGKIDLNSPHEGKVISAVAELLEVSPQDIFRVSGKTGEGVPELLHAVVQKIPPPGRHDEAVRALIFDSFHDDHKGIIAFVRNMSGTIYASDTVHFLAASTDVTLKEVGYFIPEFRAAEKIEPGEIGYLATGLKEPGRIRIGDTVTSGNVRTRSAVALPGYRDPAPVVFISFYPDRDTKFENLQQALERLRLSDAALSLEPEANDALGRGLKVGFLGELHFEITASRLHDEFHLSFITSFPTVAYHILDKGKDYFIKQPGDFPENPQEVREPIIALQILAPASSLNSVINLQRVFSMEISEVKNAGDNVIVYGTMPLAELLRDFDDRLKSASQGYASFSYERAGEDVAQAVKLEILLEYEVVPALTRIVSQKDLEREARQTVERLKALLPREQFRQAIQAKAYGRIISRETIPALRKDVTGYLYGGDRTRKMKLWKKQQRGKEKLKRMAKVSVPVEVFREILKK